jgi:hypothetical protein
MEDSCTSASTIEKHLPMLQDIIRVGAFRLACCPLTDDMKLKIDDWNGKIGQQKMQRQQQPKKNWKCDFSSDPVIELLNREHKELPEKPTDAYFVRVWCI